MAEYQIWYCDPFGRGQRRLEHWARLVVSRRLNRVGVLRELLLPLDSAPAVVMQRDAQIAIWRDGAPLLDTTWFVRRFGVVEREGARYLQLGGYDALYLLDGRIVAAASGSAGAVKSGPADDVIKAYVRENLGSLAEDAARDASRLLAVAEDVGAAPVVHRRAARQNLGRLIRGICFESAQRGVPLYVDLVPLPDGRLELRTYPYARGVDHRRGGLGPVALAVDVGTLAEAAHTRDYGDEHTVVYVGGRGLGEQRAVVEVGDPARARGSPWGRREVWFDARHLSNAEALMSAGQELLWQGLPDEQIVGVAGAGFGELWGFGDLVAAAVGVAVADCRVDACEVELDEARLERVVVGLYELTAEAALLTVAQRVEDLGAQESPEYRTLPAAGAVPLALPSGVLDDGWLAVSIARTLDLAAEVTARTAGDAALSGGLAVETSARQNADAALTSGLAAEVTARTAGDAGLTNGLATETSARQNADAALSGSLATETSARQNADSAHAALTTGVHGGIVASGEVSATPAASAIPRAGVGGTLADGWLSAAVARVAQLTWANLGGKPATLVALTSPLTAANWNGAAKGAGTITINVNTEFGVPSGAKAVALRFTATWATVGANASIRPFQAGTGVLAVRCQVANQPNDGFGIVALNANGVDIVLSAATSLTIVTIGGYWL